MVVIVMGPAGSGKTTVGRRLAERLGWRFHEGDDFHPESNVARMRAGHPLGDAERAPWLAALAALVARHVAEGTGAVLACSALRREYRRTLAGGAPPGAVRFVYLRASPELLERRVEGREGHFFTPALVASQLAALEEPAPDEPFPVLVLDAGAPAETLVARAAEWLSPHPPARRPRA